VRGVMIWRTLSSPKSKRRLKQLLAALGDRAVLGRLRQQGAQLVFCMGQHVRACAGLYAGQAKDAVGDRIEQPDRGIEDVGKDDQREPEHFEHPIGIEDGPVLRRLLAEHDVEQRCNPERRDKPDGMQFMFGEMQPPQRRGQDGGDHRLGEGAEAKAGQGDAELATGKVKIELALDEEGDSGQKALIGLRFQALRRALTAANSAATKKAFRATRASVAMIFQNKSTQMLVPGWGYGWEGGIGSAAIRLALRAPFPHSDYKVYRRIDAPAPVRRDRSTAWPS